MPNDGVVAQPKEGTGNTPRTQCYQKGLGLAVSFHGEDSSYFKVFHQLTFEILLVE